MIAMNTCVGDVVSIPAGEDSVALGQIVATYREHAIYIAVFERLMRRGSVLIDPEVVEVLQDPIVLLPLTFEDRITAGDWGRIAHMPVAADVPLPAYKVAVATYDHIDVIDYTGTISRRASKEEAALLPNRSTVFPAVVEIAVRGHFGIEPWNDRLAMLRPSEFTTSRLFGK